MTAGARGMKAISSVNWRAGIENGWMGWSLFWLLMCAAISIQECLVAVLSPPPPLCSGCDRVTVLTGKCPKLPRPEPDHRSISSTGPWQRCFLVPPLLAGGAAKETAKWWSLWSSSCPLPCALEWLGNGQARYSTAGIMIISNVLFLFVYSECHNGPWLRSL